MTQNLATRTALRPAHPEDFNYCARLYFEGMENIIKELNLNADAHAAGFRKSWDVTQVRIITLDGTDIGWLQSFLKDSALFLGQLFVDGALRRQGWHRSGQRLDRGGSESRPSGYARGCEDKSGPAALRAARVSHYARGRA